jgi:membrane-associated phospholipid phosphatase
MDFPYEQLSNYDISILRYIHHNRIESLDNFLYVISFTTSYVSISILLTILFFSYKKESPYLRSAFFKIATVLIVASLISFTLKKVISRERPFNIYPDIEKLSEAGNASFPSGHTLEAFAVAFAIAFLFPRLNYIIFVFSWACLVAYSRMALGVHYPFDVLGGILIGIGSSLVTLLIYNRIEWKKKIA